METASSPPSFLFILSMNLPDHSLPPDGTLPHGGVGARTRPAYTYHIGHGADVFSTESNGLDEMFGSGYQYEVPPVDMGTLWGNDIPLYGCAALSPPSFPAVNDFHQSSMGGGSERYQPASFGGEGQTISGANLGEHDAMTWEPSCVAGHLPIVGSDMMDMPPPAAGDNPLIFKCLQYSRSGVPCGALIEGDLDDALEHFRRTHLAGATPMKPRWTCRWGGKCHGRPMLKEGFRRHIMSHFAQWNCPGCSRTFSRDDSARKHTKKYGHGRMAVVPRVDDRL